jgi:hypothetical protein
MPKYIPTLDEIRKPQLCPICGHEIFDDKAETCGSSLCQVQWEIFKEDFKKDFEESMYKEDPWEVMKCGC